MATVTINGVPIDFPFDPYDLQKDYMEKVLDCIQNETNGVLESPTGTGKTLSLLCASLAWLQLKKAQLQVQHQTAKINGESHFLSLLNAESARTASKTSSKAFIGIPTIIYASRTHSQLSQAMQELKRTAYKHMKATVLGSREQMCIHPELISEKDNNLKRHMCQLKVQTRSCQFFNQVERQKDKPEIAELSVIDIEDMIKLGNCHKFCPYYMSKELKQQADIIFMPYNYLLDPLSRKALGVELANNIVILDEAHNIERICEDSASLQLKTADVALAIEDVTGAMKLISEDSTVEYNEKPMDISAEEMCILKQMLLDFEKEMDNIPLKDNSEGTTFDGIYVYELLAKAGIQKNNFGRVIATITNIVKFLSTINNGPYARKGSGLQVFEDFLTIVFMGTSDEFKEKVKMCYKVHVVEEQVNKKKADNWLTKAAAKGSKTKGRTLNYWCFNPGFGMDMIMGKGIKCIILTSGTLAPLRPLISELGIPIPVRLENPHIVKGNQVCVKILCQGPDSETLNSNYQNRDNPKYIASLGRAILNLTRVIPNGLLIFFPSYPIMQKTQQQWQDTGLWSNINALKAIYVEPRDKTTFNNVMVEYYSKINDPSLKGAIFMGVCRGKVSEGLDFVDANGRAVIITGLPYPPYKDPKIILKRRYLDICNSRDKEYLKGDDWYSLEATRAVNQAIGRVIRHRYDYGAILLLDTRFNNFRIKNQMSLWLRQHIKVANNFGEIMRDLRLFFQNAESSVPPPKALTSPVKQVTIPAEFEIPTIYKNNNSASPSVSINQSSSSESSQEPTQVVIYKRSMTDTLINPTKKKKITLIKNTSVSPVNTSTDAKEYIMMVRRTLDGPSFTEFTNSLTVYKENGNFDEFVGTLDKIFINKPQLNYLILDLLPYIKTKHKDIFKKYCEKIEIVYT